MAAAEKDHRGIFGEAEEAAADAAALGTTPATGRGNKRRNMRRRIMRRRLAAAEAMLWRRYGAGGKAKAITMMMKGKGWGKSDKSSKNSQPPPDFTAAAAAAGIHQADFHSGGGGSGGGFGDGKRVVGYNPGHKWGAGKCANCGGWYVSASHSESGHGYCLSAPHECRRSQIVKERAAFENRSCEEVHQEACIRMAFIGHAYAIAASTWEDTLTSGKTSCEWPIRVMRTLETPQVMSHG